MKGKGGVLSDGQGGECIPGGRLPNGTAALQEEHIGPGEKKGFISSLGRTGGAKGAPKGIGERGRHVRLGGKGKKS